MYETKIFDARWIAYDIPGNIGWIVYIVTVIIALGVIFSAVMVIKDGSVNHIIMLSGAVICFIFGGLLFIGYKKQQSDTRNR